MMRPRTRSLAFTLSLLVVGLLFGVLFRTIDTRLGIPPLLTYPGDLSGLILIAVGAWLRSWGGTVFYGKNPSMVSFKAPPTLVTTGPWKYSRNPLYLCLILIGLGFSLLFASTSDLLFTLVGAVLVHLKVVINEEKILSQKFGTEYAAYKKQVRRWV
jgi:protein-S-isoprenylcysteine O-methyltransferase Ste14